MSEDALSRAERINELFAEWAASVAGESGSGTATAVLNALKENPYCTVNKLSDQLGVAFTTAQRGVDKLVSLGVIKQIGEAKRNRVYCAWQVMDILDEPPRFT